MDDELHPGPFDGHTDHESEQNNATFIQDAQRQHVDEDPGDDFEMIDIDGNPFSREPAKKTELSKWKLQVEGFIVAKNGINIKHVADEMPSLYPDRKWTQDQTCEEHDELHIPMQKLLDINKPPRGFSHTELGAVAWWINNTRFT